MTAWGGRRDVPQSAEIQVGFRSRRGWTGSLRRSGSSWGGTSSPTHSTCPGSRFCSTLARARCVGGPSTPHRRNYYAPHRPSHVPHQHAVGGRAVVHERASADRLNEPSANMPRERCRWVPTVTGPGREPGTFREVRLRCGTTAAWPLESRRSPAVRCRVRRLVRRQHGPGTHG